MPLLLFTFSERHPFFSDSIGCDSVGLTRSLLVSLSRNPSVKPGLTFLSHGRPGDTHIPLVVEEEEELRGAVEAVALGAVRHHHRPKHRHGQHGELSILHGTPQGHHGQSNTSHCLGWAMRSEVRGSRAPNAPPLSPHFMMKLCSAEPRGLFRVQDLCSSYRLRFKIGSNGVPGQG